VTAPTPAEQPPLPAWAVVVGGAVLGLLLSVWAAFLVPVRVGEVPLPVWLVPLVALYLLALRAAREVGAAGALVPLAVWFASALLLGSPTAEQDLVVPGTASGLVYLYGGAVGWFLVAARATSSAADRRAAPGPRGSAASPGAARRR
jgi:hypothetical protein